MTTNKALTPAEYAKAHKTDAKQVRRQLRNAGYKKPASGWKITPAMQKKIAA